MNESRDSLELRNDGDERLRAHVYGLLARLLSAPPEPETLSLLTLIEARDTGDDDSLAVHWRHLRNAAVAADIDRLGEEYFSLFIGLGRGELMPFASWSLTGFLMERPLVLLRDDLARLGFERQDHVSEPEDHAAVLCDVMALLHDAEHGVDAGTAARFFRQHVGPWMGRFFQDMQTAAAADFYRAVGRFGERFMEIETRYFERAPESVMVSQFGSSEASEVGALPDTK